MILAITSVQNRLVQKVQKEECTLQPPMSLHVLLSCVEHSDQTSWRGLRVGKKIAHANTHSCFVFHVMFCLNKVTWERHPFKISPDCSAPIRILCRSIYSLRYVFVSDQIRWGASLMVPSELLLLSTMCFLI